MLGFDVKLDVAEQDRRLSGLSYADGFFFSRGRGDLSHTGKLIERSGSLFIYAATVCRSIEDPKWLPAHRLGIVLEGNGDAQSPTQWLDEMYTQILRTSVIGDCNKKEQDILTQRFRDTVGSMVVLFDSLSTAVLARLFSALSETISTTLDPLKSALNVPEDRKAPIHLLHPSFRDFLVNNDRYLDRHF